MTKNTFNIIMACKGRFDWIHSNEDITEALSKITPYERVVSFMAKECGIDERAYDGERMYNIMFDAMSNYLSTCSEPSEFIENLRIRPLPGFDADTAYKCSLKGTAERICNAFILTRVFENDGKCINGFAEHMYRHTAKEFAGYIINRCLDMRMPITNFRLQEVLFAVQEYYISKGELAFPDTIVAYDMGPVVPTVFLPFSTNYGLTEITERQPDFDIESEHKDAVDSIIKEVISDDKLHRNEIMTGPNSAWAHIWKKSGEKQDIIPTDLIFEKHKERSDNLEPYKSAP